MSEIPGIHYDVITCKYYLCFPRGDRIFEHYHYTQVVKYADKTYPEYINCLDGSGKTKSVVYNEKLEAP